MLALICTVIFAMTVVALVSSFVLLASVALPAMSGETVAFTTEKRVLWIAFVLRQQDGRVHGTRFSALARAYGFEVRAMDRHTAGNAAQGRTLSSKPGSRREPGISGNAADRRRARRAHLSVERKLRQVEVEAEASAKAEAMAAKAAWVADEAMAAKAVVEAKKAEDLRIRRLDRRLRRLARRAKAERELGLSYVSAADAVGYALSKERAEEKAKAKAEAKAEVVAETQAEAKAEAKAEVEVRKSQARAMREAWYASRDRCREAAGSSSQVVKTPALRKERQAVNVGTYTVPMPPKGTVAARKIAHAAYLRAQKVTLGLAAMPFEAEDNGWTLMLLVGIGIAVIIAGLFRKTTGTRSPSVSPELQRRLGLADIVRDHEERAHQAAAKAAREAKKLEKKAEIGTARAEHAVRRTELARVVSSSAYHLGQATPPTWRRDLAEAALATLRRIAFRGRVPKSTLRYGYKLYHSIVRLVHEDCLDQAWADGQKTVEKARVFCSKSEICPDRVMWAAERLFDSLEDMGDDLARGNRTAVNSWPELIQKAIARVERAMAEEVIRRVKEEGFGPLARFLFRHYRPVVAFSGAMSPCRRLGEHFSGPSRVDEGEVVAPRDSVLGRVLVEDDVVRESREEAKRRKDSSVSHETYIRVSVLPPSEAAVSETVFVASVFTKTNEAREARKAERRESAKARKVARRQARKANTEAREAEAYSVESQHSSLGWLLEDTFERVERRERGERRQRLWDLWTKVLEFRGGLILPLGIDIPLWAILATMAVMAVVAEVKRQGREQTLWAKSAAFGGSLFLRGCWRARMKAHRRASAATQAAVEASLEALRLSGHAGLEAMEAQAFQFEADQASVQEALASANWEDIVASIRVKMDAEAPGWDSPENQHVFAYLLQSLAGTLDAVESVLARAKRDEVSVPVSKSPFKVRHLEGISEADFGLFTTFCVSLVEAVKEVAEDLGVDTSPWALQERAEAYIREAKSLIEKAEAEAEVRAEVARRVREDQDEQARQAATPKVATLDDLLQQGVGRCSWEEVTFKAESSDQTHLSDVEAWWDDHPMAWDLYQEEEEFWWEAECIPLHEEFEPLREEETWFFEPASVKAPASWEVKEAKQFDRREEKLLRAKKALADAKEDAESSWTWESQDEAETRLLQAEDRVASAERAMFMRCRKAQDGDRTSWTKAREVARLRARKAKAEARVCDLQAQTPLPEVAPDPWLERAREGLNRAFAEIDERLLADQMEMSSIVTGSKGLLMVEDVIEGDELSPEVMADMASIWDLDLRVNLLGEFVDSEEIVEAHRALDRVRHACDVYVAEAVLGQVSEILRDVDRLALAANVSVDDRLTLMRVLWDMRVALGETRITLKKGFASVAMEMAHTLFNWVGEVALSLEANRTSVKEDR